MNEIVNNFLLAGDNIMHEMHLIQHWFTCGACRRFTTDKERIQKCKEKRYLKYVYQKELDKACSQHDMAYLWRFWLNNVDW